MPFRRTRPLGTERVQIELDGEPIEARDGEPIAVALLAAGEMRLSRSPKLHRPRGPSCLRGGCDGCLMRVDGEPNVVTCQRRVEGGERIRTQNVLGSRRLDVLRVNDWFFPKGIDHHHLLAGVVGVRTALGAFARKLGGLGLLPEEDGRTLPTIQRSCDVLVVGGGLAGLTVARHLAGLGRDVVLVDESLELGGEAVLLEPELDRTLPDGVEHLEASAIGAFEGDVIAVGPRGTHVVTPRVLCLATGAHDGALATANSELPGVFSARAALRLAHLGVALDGPVAIVGAGPFGARFRELYPERVRTTVKTENLAAIEGGSAVSGVRLASGERREVAFVLTDLPNAPSFELAAQAGAEIDLCPARGYVPRSEPNGRAGEALFVAGAAAGVAPSTELLVEQAERVARAIAEA